MFRLYTMSCLVLSFCCSACITTSLTRYREDAAGYSQEFNRPRQNTTHEGRELEVGVIDGVEYQRFQFTGPLSSDERVLEILLGGLGVPSRLREMDQRLEGTPAWLVYADDWYDTTRELFDEVRTGDLMDVNAFSQKAFGRTLSIQGERIAFLRLRVSPADSSVDAIVLEALPGGQWQVLSTRSANIPSEDIEIGWTVRSYPGWLASALAYGLTIPLDIVTSPVQVIGLFIYGSAAWQ